MTAMDTVTELSTLVLEDLDFEVPCAHSAHNRMGSMHDGEAKFVAKVMHECATRPGSRGELYPCCAKWAAHVTEHMDRYWTCPVCKVTELGSDMCVIVGPLNT